MADESLGPEKSLDRIKGFDLTKLPQKGRLGETNFEAVVAPAERIQELFGQIPTEALGMFPEKQRNIVKQQADAFYNQLEEVMNFSLDEGNVTGRRDAIVERLRNQFQSYFDSLWTHVAYIASRSQDFDSLSRQARAVLQEIQDETKRERERLGNTADDAQAILDNIRKVAAEQGVSQQAEFFKRLADGHDKHSKTWLIVSVVTVCVSAGYAILGLFFHTWEGFVPSGDGNDFLAYQFLASKILVFAVLAYGAYASVRNYFNHVHNAVINRQKQTALQTYKVLADAAKTPENRDVVLSHAAACIFGLSDTGFTRGGDSGAPHTSMIEILRNTGNSS